MKILSNEKERCRIKHYWRLKNVRKCAISYAKGGESILLEFQNNTWTTRGIFICRSLKIEIQEKARKTFRRVPFHVINIRIWKLFNLITAFPCWLSEKARSNGICLPISSSDVVEFQSCLLTTRVLKWTKVQHLEKNTRNCVISADSTKRCDVYSTIRRQSRDSIGRKKGGTKDSRRKSLEFSGRGERSARNTKDTAGESYFPTKKRERERERATERTRENRQGGLIRKWTS